MMHVSVCVGSACHLKGAYMVIAQLQALIAAHDLNDQVQLAGSFCLSSCGNGVSIRIDGETFHTTPEKTEAFFEQHIMLPLQSM